jgi:hypothetical protein
VRNVSRALPFAFSFFVSHVQHRQSGLIHGLETTWSPLLLRPSSKTTLHRAGSGSHMRRSIDHRRRQAGITCGSTGRESTNRALLSLVSFFLGNFSSFYHSACILFKVIFVLCICVECGLWPISYSRYSRVYGWAAVRPCLAQAF